MEGDHSLDEGHIVYSTNAVDRIVQYRISTAEVESVIFNHHTSLSLRRGDRMLIGEPHGRYVAVELAADWDDPLLVVTVADS